MPELANTAGFMLYPRGFLGAVTSPSIKRQPRPYAGTVSRLQNNMNFFLGGGNAAGKLEVNENVETLYALMITKPISVGDFEFREKILKCALSAFGTNQFDYWYSLQSKSPAAGELHRAFLRDTLRFISEGQRDQMLETWNVLITHADRGELKSTMDEAAVQFFGLTQGGLVRQPRNSDLLDVLQQWTGQPGGFEDLLFTLHILFGIQ